MLLVLPFRCDALWKAVGLSATTVLFKAKVFLKCRTNSLEVNESAMAALFTVFARAFNYFFLGGDDNFVNLIFHVLGILLIKTEVKNYLAPP
jgi:hypothetical protein